MISRQYEDATKRAASHSNELAEMYQGDLPLHMACRLSTSKELIEAFVKHFPSAVLIGSNKDGKLPIDIIKDQGARLRIDFSVIDILEQAMLHQEEVMGPEPLLENDCKTRKKMSLGRGLRRLSMTLARRLSICNDYSDKSNRSISRLLELSHREQRGSDEGEDCSRNHNLREKVAGAARRASAGFRRLSMTFRRNSIDRVVNNDKNYQYGHLKSTSTASQDPATTRSSKTMKVTEDKIRTKSPEAVTDCEPSSSSDKTEDEPSFMSNSTLKERFSAIQQKVLRRSNRLSQRSSTKRERNSTSTSSISMNMTVPSLDRARMSDFINTGIDLTV